MASTLGVTLVVIHDFAARSSDELTLRKGDRIELIERDDDFGDGWYLGKHLSNGKTGLFPEVYTRPAPKTFSSHSPIQNRAVDKRASSDDHLSKARQDNTAHRASAPTTTSTSASPITSHNPVMTETLDVIKEHMNDMNVPDSALDRSHSDTNLHTSPTTRASSVQGHTTDEEESQPLTETQLLTWTPARVAEYLEAQGVEKQHCLVFQEQEISGEILLGMEQSSVFIKEFELGSVGRRLKTWQKIKALQDKVRSPPVPPATSPSIAHNGHHTPEQPIPIADDKARQRSSSMAGPTIQSSYLVPASIPRISPDSRASTLPTSSSSTSIRESGIRPSAHSIRTMQHTRRHSSLGSETSMQRIMSPSVPQSTAPSSITANDRSRSSTALDASMTRHSKVGHRHNDSASSRASQAHPDWGLGPMESPEEPERATFAGNEMDQRARRSVLQKKPTSATHSRSPSNATIHNTIAAQMQPQMQPEADSPVAQPAPAPTGIIGKIKAFRSASSPKMLGSTGVKDAKSPIVTKLDHNQKPPVDQASTATSPTTLSNPLSFLSKNKSPGLRIVSDTTPTDKVGTPALNSPARTGSTSPSTGSRSFDHGKSEKSRHSTGSSQGLHASTAPATPRIRPHAKSKKFTSAYTRGLESKTPLEQIDGADYSGWMKKKSASLVGSWKPRLFILRGRRLSYYYSENDTEEKGLIDISGHRVLPAEGDKITGIHATLTGAKSPQSPESVTFVTGADMDLAGDSDRPPANNGLFIFKLVPPREGMSKAVNFTKPTVHYFAVNNRREGRLWMAALMKATIDHDTSGKVTTSYNQPTITLGQARARRERPPALREEFDDYAREEPPELDDAKRTDSGRGLGIGGLDGDSEQPRKASVDSETAGSSVVGGARSQRSVSAGGSTSGFTPLKLSIHS